MSMEEQRREWEVLSRQITGLVNRATVHNIKRIVAELFLRNIVRGRGICVCTMMSAQRHSPSFTPVFACLVSILNTKVPLIGELLISRLVLSFRHAFRQRNTKELISSSTFVAHLVNQQVCHELLALQLITALLERPTDEYVEVAVEFTKQCGAMLAEMSPQGLHAVFDRFRIIMQDAHVHQRVLIMIENLMAIRKSGFASFPPIPRGLDLVVDDDVITHEIALDDDNLDPADYLDTFRFDDRWEDHDAMYLALRREILGSEFTDEAIRRADDVMRRVHYEDSDNAEDQDANRSQEDHPGNGKDSVSKGEVDGQTPVIDMTDSERIELRKRLYLTIMSSINYEEVAHKIARLRLPETQTIEVARMVCECACQERSFTRFFALLAQRFCEMSRPYRWAFEDVFEEKYNDADNLDSGKLRNLGMLFAHLLTADVVSWSIFRSVRLSEDSTTASSRIFLRVVFETLAELMGVPKLAARVQDPVLWKHNYGVRSHRDGKGRGPLSTTASRTAPVLAGLFPRDILADTRFAINFWSIIGLGELSVPLRQFYDVAVAEEEVRRTEEHKRRQEQQVAAREQSLNAEFDREFASGTWKSEHTWAKSNNAKATAETSSKSGLPASPQEVESTTGTTRSVTETQSRKRPRSPVASHDDSDSGDERRKLRRSEAHASGAANLNADIDPAERRARALAAIQAIVHGKSA